MRIKTKIAVSVLALILLSVLAGACGHLETGENQALEENVTLNSGPSVTLEVFPVFLSRGKPFVLIPEDRDSWQIPLGTDPHANLQVKEKLTARGLEAEIIHSTSWRQDQQDLVLTYVCVIAGPGRIPKGFSGIPVEKSGIVRSGATTPPPEIPAKAVIHHAFQHLAWINRTDPEIRKNLGKEWQKILEVYEIQPAKMMDD